MQNALKVAT